MGERPSMNEGAGDRARLTRRRFLGLGAIAVVGAACAPAVTSPPGASAAPQPVATATAAAAVSPAATSAPPPAPTPVSITSVIASMKDPLVDDHTHPIVPTQGDQTKYFDGLVQLMDQNNVAFSITHRNAQWAGPGPTFGREHDDWVRAAMDRHPGRILGGLGGFDPSSPDAPAYVRAQLQTGKWAYVGELDLRNPGPKTQIPINSPVMLEVAKVAAEFKVPVVFHYNWDYPSGDPAVGLAELEDALAKNPQTIYMQAHNPAVPLMPKYANLWGELSLYNTQMPIQQFMQQLAQTPATLDRLCLCISDIQTPDLQVVAGLPQAITYAEATKRARDFLSTLAPDIREKIAYKNLLRLLKLS